MQFYLIVFSWREYRFFSPILSLYTLYDKPPSLEVPRSKNCPFIFEWGKGTSTTSPEIFFHAITFRPYMSIKSCRRFFWTFCFLEILCNLSKFLLKSTNLLKNKVFLTVLLCIARLNHFLTNLRHDFDPTSLLYVLQKKLHDLD